MNRVTPEFSHVEITGHRLEYYWTRIRAAGETVIVFLHEGLGSAGLWRDFPLMVAERTGLPTLVYSRYGYGGSTVLGEERPLEYMHREALEALPELRDALGLDDVILFGHSDGGSIALLHAGAGQWPVRGLIVEAPHVFVEDETIAGIEDATVAYNTTDLPSRIARHHSDGEATFRGWNDIWLKPLFRDWNIEDCLPGVTAPVLVIQGEGDEYGTARQLDAIAAQVSGPSETLLIPDCHHSPHRDQADAVLDATARFVGALLTRTSE
jgi:pimeloyl-ACP methyl ester carboxylesterase